MVYIHSYKYLSEDDNIIGLEIEDIDESDAGEYTCVATNEKGEDSFSCQLNVNGKSKQVRLFDFLPF